LKASRKNGFDATSPAGALKGWVLAFVGSHQNGRNPQRIGASSRTPSVMRITGLIDDGERLTRDATQSPPATPNN
jgi:hypothetical protein